MGLGTGREVPRAGMCGRARRQAGGIPPIGSPRYLVKPLPAHALSRGDPNAAPALRPVLSRGGHNNCGVRAPGAWKQALPAKFDERYAAAVATLAPRPVLRQTRA